ncbi:MAG TPA: Rieske (2Fe-2S) protein [Nitrososphaerales archaeon]|nr:Rieske (2Fe-2S) protein [Nitrososphaerales archaeon]
MNRREFIRTAIATTTLMAVGATGLFEIAAKSGANQAASQQQAQQLQLPPVSTAASQSSTAQLSQGASSAASSSQASTSSSQSSTVSTQSSSAATPAGYVLVAQLSSLSGKTSAYFTHPTHGNSILLSLNGQWKAFSATCTHRPCTVGFQSSELYCPCHGATFSASNGSVTRGPAQVSLAEYGVIEQGGGLYVSASRIN